MAVSILTSVQHRRTQKGVLGKIGVCGQRGEGEEGKGKRGVSHRYHFTVPEMMASAVRLECRQHHTTPSLRQIVWHLLQSLVPSRRPVINTPAAIDYRYGDRVPSASRVYLSWAMWDYCPSYLGPPGGSPEIQYLGDGSRGRRENGPYPRHPWDAREAALQAPRVGQQ